MIITIFPHRMGTTGSMVLVTVTVMMLVRMLWSSNNTLICFSGKFKLQNQQQLVVTAAQLTQDISG